MSPGASPHTRAILSRLHRCAQVGAGLVAVTVLNAPHFVGAFEDLQTTVGAGVGIDRDDGSISERDSRFGTSNRNRYQLHAPPVRGCLMLILLW